MEISHEEFVTILKQKDKYEKMIEKEKTKIMPLNSVNSRKTSL